MKKEELVVILVYRMKNKMHELFDSDLSGHETEELIELCNWLIESGMVTEKTMFDEKMPP